MNHPTEDQVEILRGLVAREFINSQLMRDSLRVSKHTKWGIRCKAFYFKDREAITFNEEGFVGFAGWADDGNVQPILRACVKWVEETTSYVA
jgi:hypothetical protein